MRNYFNWLASLYLIMVYFGLAFGLNNYINYRTMYTYHLYIHI